MLCQRLLRILAGRRLETLTIRDLGTDPDGRGPDVDPIMTPAQWALVGRVHSLRSLELSQDEVLPTAQLGALSGLTNLQTVRLPCAALGLQEYNCLC